MTVFNLAYSDEIVILWQALTIKTKNYGIF